MTRRPMPTLVRTIGVAGVLLSVAIGNSTARAESDIHEKAGTRSAAFLKMESGSRGAAMGGTAVGITGDLDAAFGNPAALSSIDGRQITGTHDFSFGGISHDTLIYAHRVSPKLAVGATFQGVFASIERRAGDTLEADSEFTASTYAIGGAAACRLGSLSIGGAVKGIREDYDIDTVTGASFDLGAQLSYRKIDLGGSVLNLGPDIDDAPLPTTVRLGASACLSDDGPMVAVDVVMPSDGDTSVRAGTEQWFRDQIAFRAGYQFANSESPANGFSVGIGLRSQGTKALENVDFQLDYAFVPDDGVGDGHRVSFLARF